MFYYFGYGSNLSETALRAKRVRPISAEPATLDGWHLCFDIPNFFSIEGGTGNIERIPGQRVHGVLYGCEDQDLAALDELEALNVAYSRQSMTVETYAGKRCAAYVYIGLDGITTQGLKPSRRYLNILIQGAEAWNLDATYIEQLRRTEVCLRPKYGAYQFPREPDSVFSREQLSARPELTAIAGAVFDMSAARVEHHYLKQLLGGRDVTLFFLRRMDSSDSTESWEHIESGALSPLQKEYLNDYLHQFNREYRYAGRTRYAEALHRPRAATHRPPRVSTTGQVASRRVLRSAELCNRTLGHENLGFLSEAHGFMPTTPPSLGLNPDFACWDQVAVELPSLYRQLSVRPTLEALPVLDASADVLPDHDLLRAACVLGMLAHAFWYSETEPPLALPDSISIPWAKVRRRLGRPDPVLSYIDLIVYNWCLQEPEREDPMRLDNLMLLIPTVDNREERTFYLTQTEILAQASPIISAVVRAQEAVAHDDPKSLCDELSVIIDSLQRIVRESLLNINPNPESVSFVDPIIWAKTVAPFAVPMERGQQGPSGTSSPIFNLLDIFFGRRKHETFLGREIRQLRNGYPLFWREFLDAVHEVSVPTYVASVGDPMLEGLLKDAVEVYAGENGFLGRHRMKVYGYLEQAFKVGRSVTIGGFSGVFRDRTWDQVDTELEYSRVERLETFPKGCHYALVRSVGQTHTAAPKGVKHVVLDVEGSGVRYKPGDRCGILPENSEELVSRTLQALHADGQEQMELTPEWLAAVHLRAGYENATTLSVRDLLTFGRIRPILPRVAEALHAATQNPSLLHAVIQQTTTRWELWDLLNLLENEGYDPKRLWQAPLRSSEHICRVVPPETFRMYSICSAQEPPGQKPAKEIELTVGRVRYTEPAAITGELSERHGTASNFLARAAGRRTPIAFIIEHPPRFSLPENKSAPIVMLAGGTGISPFRSFMLERFRHEGGHCYLFLALRSYENFYYQDELLHWVECGKLTLQVAFSRDDTAIRYVDNGRGGQFVRDAKQRRHIQELLLDDANAALLKDLLKSRATGGAGAYVYICGRSRFARTVHDAFRALLGRFHDGNEETRTAAVDLHLSQMVAEGRYMQEIFTDARTWNQDRPQIAASDLIQRNNPQDGFWLVIDGLVYDLTEFSNQHPGGPHVLMSYAGTDATLGYQRAHRNRSEIDAMREMYEVGQLKPLDLTCVVRSVEVDGRHQNIALSTLYRAWLNLSYLVVEVQNALRNDQSLQGKTTIGDDPPRTQSPYKLQRAIETHERFLRSYLDGIMGEPSMKLWRLVRGMCSSELSTTWMEERARDVASAEPTRFVEAMTGELKRQLQQSTGNEIWDRNATRAKLAITLEKIFGEDEKFLARIKVLLKEGLLVFEEHESETLQIAGEKLVKLVASIPDVVEAYYLSVADICQATGWYPSTIPPKGSAAPRSRAPLTTLVSTDYWLMEEMASRKVVLLKRHAVAVDSIEELIRQNHKIIALMRPEHADYGIIVDMRQAPSRNDPEFEDAMSQMRSEIFRHYARVAVLVTSAVGVLQVNRMARDEGADTFATQSEVAAFRYAARS